MNAPVNHFESGAGDSADAATYRFEQVSDADLLASKRRLVGRSNQLLAELLAHLAEVETRGIHRVRACSSLYMYCVYELRLSEDAAFRRARAARVARKFPVILRQVADGELHLTALVVLAPHLTDENHRELLALAKHRTKREVLRLVRALAPLPTVPDRVEPLGPEPVGIPMPGKPTWRKLVESFAAGVRDLPPGDRPKDWIDRIDRASAAPDRDSSEQPTNPSMTAIRDLGEGDAVTRERYKVAFTASQEYIDLLERAQGLLSHAVPNRSLEEVHLRALRLLVEKLETRKYGAPRSQRSAVYATPESAATNATSADTTEVPSTVHTTAGGAIGTLCAEAQPRGQQSAKRARRTRQRGSAGVRREVRERDGLQCSFVDEDGRRCPETRFLELHHIHAHARGGGETARNLAIFCVAHNTLAAEQDFGRKFILERR